VGERRGRERGRRRRARWRARGRGRGIMQGCRGGTFAPKAAGDGWELRPSAHDNADALVAGGGLDEPDAVLVIEALREQRRGAGEERLFIVRHHGPREEADVASWYKLSKVKCPNIFTI
jgi:hypothetical protein